MQNISPSLQKELKTISEKCTSCDLCQRECSFLRKYGKPGQIANTYHFLAKAHPSMPFECSLCQLCAAVCSAEINPANMFSEMRRESIRQKKGDYHEHSALFRYERRGTSPRYSWYALPRDCDTIFFPGCTLTGTRPDKTIKLYEHIRKSIPALGIVLDCCTKPSHNLGRETYFTEMFQEMKRFLSKNRVRNVIAACPNCYTVFSRYGGEISAKTAYEVMAENGLPDSEQVSGTVTIHDPCILRFEKSVHSAVRSLIRRKGLTVEEMPHHGKKAICCGEGGAVAYVSSEFADKWRSLRKEEAEDRRIIAYCAGCANFLSPATRVSHIADILFEPKSALAGKVKVSKPPFTYLNRLLLKRQIRKTVDASITRERP